MAFLVSIVISLHCHRMYYVGTFEKHNPPIYSNKYLISITVSTVSYLFQEKFIFAMFLG